MNKDLKARAEKYAVYSTYPRAVRFSTTVPDARYKGYRYFFMFLNTNGVAEAFKTQKDLDSFLRKNDF